MINFSYFYVIYMVAFLRLELKHLATGSSSSSLTTSAATHGSKMLINFQEKKIIINPRALEAVTLYFKP
jgi:hypothetical protein